MNENKILLAVIGYIFGLFWIPLFLSDRDDFCKYHGRQALVIFLALVATIMAFALLTLLFGWFKPLETLFWLIEGVLILLYIGISVIAAIKAAHGEIWRIPILGAYSDRIKF